MEFTDFSMLKNLLAAIKKENPAEELAFSIIWYSAMSNLRGAGPAMKLPVNRDLTGWSRYSLTLPSGLQGQLGLRIFITRGADDNTEKKFSPRAGGCIFQSSSFNIALTGQRSLFPVSYIHMGANKPLWKLEFHDEASPDILERNLGDFVAVYINRDHPDHLYLLQDRTDCTSLKEEAYSTIFLLIMQKIHRLSDAAEVDIETTLDDIRNGSVLAAFRYWRDTMKWSEDPVESPLELYDSIKKSLISRITDGG